MDDYDLYTHDDKPINYWRQQRKPDMEIPLQKNGDCKFSGMCYKRQPAGLVREQFTPTPTFMQNSMSAESPAPAPAVASHGSVYTLDITNTTILFTVVIFLMCMIIYHLKKLTQAITYQNMSKNYIMHSP